MNNQEQNPCHSGINIPDTSQEMLNTMIRDFSSVHADRLGHDIPPERDYCVRCRIKREEL